MIDSTDDSAMTKRHLIDAVNRVALRPLFSPQACWLGHFVVAVGKRASDRRAA
jgi:hypothetical protein